MAGWTEDRLGLVGRKKALADALTQTMSVRVRMNDGSALDGKLINETLEGEMASGGRLAYRATVTLYARPSGFTELDLLDILSFEAIDEISN
jgi:hypothetical protein